MIHSIGFGFGGFAFLVVWNRTFLVKIDSGYGGSWSACAGWREGRIFLKYHLIRCHPGYDMFEKTTSNAERAVQPVRWFWLHHVASLQSNPFHVGAGIINFLAKVSRRSSSRCAFQALVITSRRDSRGILWLGRALCVNSTWCSLDEFGHAAASLRRVRWSSDFSCMVRYLVGSSAFLRGITTFHRYIYIYIYIWASLSCVVTDSLISKATTGQKSRRRLHRFLELKSIRKMLVQDSTCHATSSTNSSQTLQASGAGAQVEDGRGNWCCVACSKLKDDKLLEKASGQICTFVYVFKMAYPCLLRIQAFGL